MVPCLPPSLTHQTSRFTQYLLAYPHLIYCLTIWTMLLDIAAAYKRMVRLITARFFLVQSQPINSGIVLYWIIYENTPSSYLSSREWTICYITLKLMMETVDEKCVLWAVGTTHVQNLPVIEAPPSGLCSETFSPITSSIPDWCLIWRSITKEIFSAAIVINSYRASLYK